MTSTELYKKLDEAGLRFAVIEMFEGIRLIEFLVDEVDEPEGEE